MKWALTSGKVQSAESRCRSLNRSSCTVAIGCIIRSKTLAGVRLTLRRIKNFTEQKYVLYKYHAKVTFTLCLTPVSAPSSTMREILFERLWGCNFVITLKLTLLLVIWLRNGSVKKIYLFVVLQDLWDTVAILVYVNTSIVVWVNTVWSTMRLVKGSASAWTTANHIINLCVAQMGSCTRTIVSSIGPPVSMGSASPSCTLRSASTKVRDEQCFLTLAIANVSGKLRFFSHSWLDLDYLWPLRNRKIKMN